MLTPNEWIFGRECLCSVVGETPGRAADSLAMIVALPEVDIT